jgi:hypothetical protein
MAKRDTPRTGRHFTRLETPRRTDGRRIRTRSRQGPAPTARATHREAQQELRRFRKGSTLALEIGREIARAEHARRILPAYPRRETVAYERWPAPEQP